MIYLQFQMVSIKLLKIKLMIKIKNFLLICYQLNNLQNQMNLQFHKNLHNLYKVKIILLKKMK